MIDIKNKKCEHIGCTTRSVYGIPGEGPSRCSQHKQIGMIKRSKSKCKHCKNMALYGVQYPIHCEQHKEENDLNWVEVNCRSCHLLMVVDREGYCEYCHPESFVVCRLAKQTGLMNYLNNIGLEGTSTDVMIDGGICGRERPDRMYDFGDKIVILECDEHQHRDRACECEQTRMINIYHSMGGLPVYFIRWNPDDYKNEICDTITKRYKLVGDLIQKIKDGCKVPNVRLAVLYMYYDGWEGMSRSNWMTMIDI
jgi:hypothetical protein